MTEVNNMSGSLVISEDVIATIALNAAKDVDGVAEFGNRPTDLYTTFKFNTENLKHVKVSLSSFDIKVHLYVVLNSTAKIQEVSENIQNAVKDAIQNMIGRVVTRVDVTITGIKSDVGEAVSPVEPTNL